MEGGVQLYHCLRLKSVTFLWQGFASGDLEGDAAAIRLFADAGMEMLLAQSYAKNMGAPACRHARHAYRAARPAGYKRACLIS